MGKEYDKWLVSTLAIFFKRNRGIDSELESGFQMVYLPYEI